MTTLLVVEDDIDIADMLNAYFRVQGYEIIVVNWGEDVIPAVQRQRPDLIILDIRLPDIDGYEVARRLRDNRRYADIPIIFLTDRRARADRLQGLSLGADDYVTKPFDIQELRLRIRNALRRARQGGILNPVTGLPEGDLVEEQLQVCLNTHTWAIVAVTIHNMDNFREAYGFVAADDVLRAISVLINSTARDICGSSAFVGHLDQTDFITIITANELQTLLERLQTRLVQSLEFFYPLKDRESQKTTTRRLAVQIQSITANQGPYKNIANLKSKLALA